METDQALDTPIARHVWQTRCRAGASGAQSDGTIAYSQVSFVPACFMELWDAMMAMLRSDHPDMIEFIDAKRRICRLAYDMGLKSCTAFRPGVARRAVLAPMAEPALVQRCAGNCT